jgi:hypothetical protein
MSEQPIPGIGLSKKELQKRLKKIRSGNSIGNKKKKQGIFIINPFLDPDSISCICHCSNYANNKKQ